MSLSNTCLDCHSNKAEFCDNCHTYASVKPVLLGLPHRQPEGEIVMDTTRRRVLKIAGLSACGHGGSTGARRAGLGAGTGSRA